MFEFWKEEISSPKLPLVQAFAFSGSGLHGFGVVLLPSLKDLWFCGALETKERFRSSLRSHLDIHIYIYILRSLELDKLRAPFQNLLKIADLCVPDFQHLLSSALRD